MSTLGPMRRVHFMLLITVVLWSLNLTFTRYILTHGFQPLSYATVRYGLAAAIFVGVALFANRTLRVARRDIGLLLLAALALMLNQFAFVYALDSTSASTIALILGATPIFAALLGLALGTEPFSKRFWASMAVSFAGVALVTVGGGGELAGGIRGDVLGIAAAASWAVYAVIIAPLMGRYTATQISAVVLPLTWVGIALVGARQTADQDFGVSWAVWALLLAATLGPLVLTNYLWFRALHEVGASRATLVANLQPFVAAFFAVLLLSETMTLTQFAGGLLIGGGILLARRRTARAIPIAAE